jgi:hypothetical protein
MMKEFLLFLGLFAGTVGYAFGLYFIADCRRHEADMQTLIKGQTADLYEQVRFAGLIEQQQNVKEHINVVVYEVSYH